MARLTILGDVDLRADDGAVVGSVLSQPRRFALLIYLALEASGGGVSRDRVLGVFWPEMAQDRARQALRTALHFLRRSLGREAIVGHGDLLHLDPGTVVCDAVAFRSALARGDREEALRLYGGDLLPGFHVDGATVQLEQWLGDARTALRREAARGAWELADELERVGNAAGAGARAREAADLSDGDESAVRRSIELLGRIGDRAGALAAYEDLARRLESDFHTTPSPETEAVIARVRDTGPEPMPAGFGGEAGSPRSEPDAVPGVDPFSADESGELVPVAVAVSDRRGPWRSLLSGGVTLVLMAAFYSLWGLNRADTAWTMPNDIRPVVHLDELRDFSADGSSVDLAGALTLELVSRLSEIDGLQVTSGEARVAGSSVEPGTPKYRLRGGITRSDSGIRATLLLLDGSSGISLDRIVAGTQSTGATATIDELAENLGRQIRRDVGRAVEDHERSLAADNPRALQKVRLAVRDMEAGDSLRRANAPEAAEASFEAADALLAEAQSLARGWSEPSVQRAELAFRKMWLHLLPPQRNPEAAVRVLREGIAHSDAALKIAPTNPAALELRGTLRYWQWQLDSTPDRNEADRILAAAIADLDRATQHDPGRARAWSVLSAALETRGEFARANVAARRAYNSDPFLASASDILARLFFTSVEIGDTAGARGWCETIAQRISERWLVSYCELELLAWSTRPGDVVSDSVRSIIERGVDGAAGSPFPARLEMLGSVVLARSGARAEALSAIDRAYRSGVTDPKLLELEAWSRLALGETRTAADLFGRAVQANPRRAGATLESRRFESLRSGSGHYATAPSEAPASPGM